LQKNVQLPSDYRIIWGGEFEDLERAQKRLEVIIPISLPLIFVLLYALFNSLHDSLLALAGIPFAIAGGVPALYVAGLDFSISAARVGFPLRRVSHGRRGRPCGPVRSDVPGCSPSDAADADDRVVSLHRSAPAGDVDWIGNQVRRPLATVAVGGMLIGPIMLLVVVPRTADDVPRRRWAHGRGRSLSAGARQWRNSIAGQRDEGAGRQTGCVDGRIQNAPPFADPRQRGIPTRQTNWTYCPTISVTMRNMYSFLISESSISVARAIVDRRK
jgi:hypothetical protein